MALQLTDATFESEVLNSDIPVLLDFYADWCGPCKMIAPLIDELATEFEGKAKVAKLNVDDNGVTAQKYQITTIPTLLIFKNGEVVDKVSGAVPKAELVKKLNAYL